MSTRVVTVAIDTEEDNWGHYVPSGHTTVNIGHLPELQERFDEWGVRPTYLVNHPPLISAPAVEVLGRLAARDDIEIGGHCHPWNTPPASDPGEGGSMMSAFPVDRNVAWVREVTARIRQELGTRPRSFRSGRWAFGPSVSRALHTEGYQVDCSVTPFMDWSASGGPDFSRAPRRPYRFHPADPLTPARDGVMVEVPATVGFLRGEQAARAALRRRLRRSAARHLRIVGILDRTGLLSKRWLSPEESSAQDMIRLVDALAEAGDPVLGITFHSCTLLPGATPYVRTAADRARFLDRLETVLRHCASAGFAFRTIAEAAEAADDAD